MIDLSLSVESIHEVSEELKDENQGGGDCSKGQAEVADNELKDGESVIE